MQQSKPSKNFDQIKPFLRMLEGSIDDARKRRLGHDTVPPAPGTAGRTAAAPANAAQPGPGNPIPMPANHAAPPAAGPEADRPLRATPIKPKQSLHPTGFRPTGS